VFLWGEASTEPGAPPGRAGAAGRGIEKAFVADLTQGMAEVDRLLRATSRSFYLTLRVLPGAIRPQIALAYLLARTSDTIADTELVSSERRLAALTAFRTRILDPAGPPPDFGELAARQGSAAERVLLEQWRVNLDLLRALSAADQQLVVELLQVIIGGQELDLRRFAGASAEQIVSLRTAGELDDYTYRVAGCVGEFWTRMCRAHLLAKQRLDDGFLLANGVRFGKGLQLVNVLRDLPADLRQGRCYLPAEQLLGLGLTPRDLLQPSNEPRLRPLYNAYLDQAEGHLAAGWAYTNALPRRCVRVRLACAWPLLIGRQTLCLLRQGRILDAEHPLKVSRPEVKRILWRSVLSYPLPRAWERLFLQACKDH
jgi:farnesyl-diphosphate farnesyltransferase